MKKSFNTTIKGFKYKKTGVLFYQAWIKGGGGGAGRGPTYLVFLNLDQYLLAISNFSKQNTKNER